MKFVTAFQGATIIPIDFNPGPVNATAFAAKTREGKTILAIINKDSQSLRFTNLDAEEVLSLTAASPDSRDVVLRDVPKSKLSTYNGTHTFELHGGQAVIMKYW